MLDPPFSPVPFHQTGFDFIARGERKQCVFLDDAPETRQRAAHQQRALLPVAAQKNLWRQAP